MDTNVNILNILIEIRIQWCIIKDHIHGQVGITLKYMIVQYLKTNQYETLH